uniref:Uncharacterized protein n=1 Tax=Anguilla anguilla TaxID=7936 RepID=A0A0E9TFB7_ANGAN
MFTVHSLLSCGAV